MTNIENKFCVQGKHFFLTYSQCNHKKKEDLLNFLEKKVKHLVNYIVAEELHKDKGKHYHCYLETDKRRKWENPRFFDWEGFHPKVETCKDENKVMRYCKKEGDYITNMTFDTFIRARTLAKEGKWLDGLKIIIEEKPEEIRYLDKWEKNLKRISAIYSQKTQKIKYNKEDFRKTSIKWKKNTTLVIEGKSGWGKTQYAKTLLKNPLMVRHMDKLKKFDEYEHDGIIFDDMNFSHWPRESCIHLLDVEEDSDINVKCGMVTIPAGTPRIIITNRGCKDIFPCFDTAISRRISSYKIKHDLRKKKNKKLRETNGDLDFMY